MSLGGDSSVRHGSNWFSWLLSMYSKTARVQSGASQREVRFLSIPFIHSLIQLEGNYRPPRGFKILIGFCSHQGASQCRIPPDCTGWCLYRCAVCKTPEEAAANRQEGALRHNRGNQNIVKLDSFDLFNSVKLLTANFYPFEVIKTK